MSKSKSKIVDLVQSEDGTYEPKRERGKFNVKGKGLVKHNKDEKPKYIMESHADDFLNGIDIGLDFIDKVMPRVDRFLKLRG